MALPRRRPLPKVLTAAATQYEASRTAGSRRMEMAWQRRALEHYELLGEVRYASHFYARMLSRIRLFPAQIQPDGQLVPITSGPPVDALDRIQDPGGGRTQIQGNYGRLMFITGEGHLFGANLQTDEEVWRFIWNEEMKKNDRTGATIRINSLKEEIEEGISYRMWRPNPRFSDVPDAPLRAVSDICEELILLTKAVQSTAVTRLLNGILLMPQEISPGSAEPLGDEDPENNPFVADLIDHFTGQIENPGSAEARVPPIVEGSYEYLDRIKWLELHDPKTDYMEKDLRDEAIKRLAIGLDFPPEVLLGMTDANHWTAKQVVSDMWRSHGAPIAEQFCTDLSEAYLRPYLREAGEDWMKVVVSYDDADVIVAPDQSEDADNAFDRGALSYEGYRKLKGIPEAMHPSKEEHDEWLAWKLRDPFLLDGQGPQVTPVRGPTPGPVDATNPSDGPPSPGAKDVSRPQAGAKIIGAAELALMRCREVAGARIRSFKQSCPECFTKADGKPNSVVAAVLGPDVLGELKAPAPLSLVASGTDSFQTILLGWGLGKTQASALGEMVEVYAARTLFDEHPAPLSSGFIAHVERVLEASDLDGGG